MIGIRMLRKDAAGSTAVEFAIAVPVLILFIYGFFTIGMLYRANAGLQHALGEAARFATLYVEANDGPPTDTEIQTMIANSDFGLDGGTLQSPVIDNSQFSNGYKTITLTYTRPTEFLYFEGPTVTLTRSKRVYIARPSA
jgi:Flp pilus assembly protein TadG